MRRTRSTKKICTESGKLATQYCPQTRNSSYGGTVPKETLNLWNTNGASKTAGGKITETCTIHTKPAEKPKEVEKPKDNTTNTANNNNKTNNNTNTNSTNAKKKMIKQILQPIIPEQATQQQIRQQQIQKKQKQIKSNNKK